MENLQTENMEVFKTKLKLSALSSFDTYRELHTRRQGIPENLTKNEFEALKSLSARENLVIQKSDKGNSIVLLDRDVYNSSVENLLSDTTKFREVVIPENKRLLELEKIEKRVRACLSKLENKGKLEKSMVEMLKPIGSKPGVLYGLPKIHKDLVNGAPKFRPILSSIGTATYKTCQIFRSHPVPRDHK